MIVTGALGRMGSITAGKLRESQEFALTAEVDARLDACPDISALDVEADVIIDFSHHTAAPGIMQWAKAHNTAVVMCTTGHTEEELEAIRLEKQRQKEEQRSNLRVAIGHKLFGEKGYEKLKSIIKRQ